MTASNRKLFLHRTAYQKWQKGGRRDLNDEELAVLEEYDFRAPGESGPLIMSLSAPSRVDVLLKEADSLKTRNMMSDAEVVYRSIVSFEPNSSKAQMYLALFLQFDMGKMEEAILFLRYNAFQLFHTVSHH
jgi:hypothetical protein